jgi:hypothetical protein
MDHSKMNHGPGEKANLPQHAREEYGPTVD